MDEEYARKKALMDRIVAGMAGRHYPKPEAAKQDKTAGAPPQKPAEETKSVMAQVAREFRLNETPEPYQEARVFPRLGRAPKPKPPEQTIPMPKMGPKTFVELAEKVWVPFAMQGIEHGLGKAKERVKEEANGLVSKLAYPEELINETVRRKLCKY